MGQPFGRRRSHSYTRERTGTGAQHQARKLGQVRSGLLKHPVDRGDQLRGVRALPMDHTPRDNAAPHAHADRPDGRGRIQRQVHPFGRPNPRDLIHRDLIHKDAEN